MNSIKRIILIFIAAGLVNGCGSNLADQIEGVKWQADNGKKLQFLRFLGGEMQQCSIATLSQWKTTMSYEFGEKKLTIIGEKPEEKMDIDVSIEGKDKGRILILNSPETGPQKFAISTVTDVCPI